MKKNLIASMALTLLFPIMASAQNQGGFVSDSAQEIISVNSLNDMPDDSYVVLKGNIVSKSGSETYTFKDSTGSVQIEIDDDDWNGLTVKPENLVIIEGEIDKSFTGPLEVEVDSIRLAN